MMQLRRQYQTLFHNMAQGAFLLLADGRLSDVNPAALEILGLDRDDVVGSSPSTGMLTLTNEAGERLAPEQYPCMLALSTGKPVMDVVARAFNPRRQAPVWLIINAFPIFSDDDTTPDQVFVTIHDITELKQREKAIQVKQATLQAFYDSAPFMMGICELNGDRIECISCNQVLGDHFGGKAGDVIGKNSCQLGIPNANEQLWVANYRKCLETGRPVQFDFEEQRRGRTYCLRGTASLIDLGESGKPRFSFVIEDITERRRAEEERLALERQLLHSQKLDALGLLAGGIAHDFNNILMAIMGNADLALMQIAPGSPIAGNLQTIESAATRAADLTRQMLAYSGKGRFLVEYIDLNRFLENTLKMLAAVLSKRTALRLDLQPELPSIEADPSQLRQVIVNLVTNAAEAIGDDEGSITIATGYRKIGADTLKEIRLHENLVEGNYVYFTVADTGSGMAPEIVARMFDPFFSTKFTGRGLGLAAVQGIVRGHKGGIKVMSQLGAGSSVSVFLPARKRPAPPVEDEQIDTALWSGTVLLVDDEEAVRSTSLMMLQKLGFEVITATDGKNAVSLFKEHREVDLIILDMTMPIMDGRECLRRLRQIDPEVKVIITSGYSEQEVTRKFAGLQITGFMQKPYNLTTIRKSIAHIKAARTAE